MSKVCSVTGKHPVTGGSIVHRGQSKSKGGIGLQLVKVNKRKFRPNLQRVRVVLPSGQVKKVWVSTRALKSGKVTKA
jgi:large subunit ribosomal protein L28